MRKEMRLTTEGDRDSLGRCRFMLKWEQGGRECGQCFHAVPEETMAGLEKRGWVVILTSETSQAEAA